MIKKIKSIISIFLVSLIACSFNDMVFSFSENTNVERISSRRNVIDPGFSYEDGSDLGGFVSYTRIYLNVMNSVTINPGEIKYFTYTPEAGFYLVVETFGQYDTKLRIENTSSGMIVDNNSGLGNNAKIEFLGVQSQPLYIAVRLSDNSAQGTFSLQIRKQRFSMFGYVDSEGYSTIPDLEIPYNEFSSLYETIKYENTSASDALSFDDRDAAKINSQIMFFSGHGYGSENGHKGFGVVFKYGDISNTTNFSMDKNKISVWAACYSANSNNVQNLSIAEHAINLGAKSSLGFTDSITFASSRVFTNRFFEKLATGSTVSESAVYASNGLLWPWDNARGYVIFGDGDVTVFDETPTSLPFNIPRINLEILNELDSSYIEYKLNKNTIRYYKEINSFLTNSFVDVYYNEYGDIIGIDDKRCDINNILNIKEEYLNYNVPTKYTHDEEEYLLDKIDSRNIIYYYMNNEFIPIEIIFASYRSENKVCQIPYAINLNAGTSLDYSLINSLI